MNVSAKGKKHISTADRQLSRAKSFVHISGTSRLFSPSRYETLHIGIIPLNNKSEITRLSDTVVKRRSGASF